MYSEVIVVLASSWPTQWPSAAWAPSRKAWAREMAESRAVTEPDGNMRIRGPIYGSPDRQPRAEALRLPVHGGVPGRRGSRPRPAPHAAVRGRALADRLGARVVFHPRRDPVRPLSLHRAHSRPGAIRRRRAVLRLAVVHLPRLRRLLFGPFHSEGGFAPTGASERPLPTLVARLRLAPHCLPPGLDCAGEAGARTGLGDRCARGVLHDDARRR